MSEQDIETIELGIDQARNQINNMEAFHRLAQNTDFKTVIEKGYFEKEASRLVLLKADSNLQEDVHQKAIMYSIDAIGHFRQYLMTINQLGQMATKALADDEATREALLAEDMVN